DENVSSGQSLAATGGPIPAFAPVAADFFANAGIKGPPVNIGFQWSSGFDIRLGGCGKGRRMSNPLHWWAPQQVFTWNHAQSGVVVLRCVVYLGENGCKNRSKTDHFGYFQCKINRLQPPWKTLLHCKNMASGSRSGARRTTRWFAARANTPTISTSP